MVLSWIHNSIQSSIAKSILWIEKAHEVWKDLEERFSQSDIFRIADIQEDIHRLHQGNSSVSDFFIELKTLWDELDNLQPLPKCVCGASDKLKKSREQDQAFSLISQQERQMNLEQGVSGEISIGSKAYVAEQQRTKTYVAEQQRPRTVPFGRGRTGGRGRGTKLCTYCGRTNHTVETCYAKHGYPPGFRNNWKLASANAIDVSDENVQSHEENKVSLSQSEYQNFLQLMNQSKVDTVEENNSHTAHFAQAKHDVHGVAFNTNSGKNFKHWIIDTGATDHIS
ncbi:uncharacterized protein LOC133305825 [Gastrolobium bilobum]|uniref:uncharacterized protein LOC133305825 n=1 Tax=Gastrolobium bilobum TaxID=150636 RepID=UPI002AB24A27|nr:uncharacterized protein LOC133305825 [Gastrolobium bilobum]